MIDLHTYKGFCTVNNDTSKEFKMVYYYCYENGILHIRVNKNVPCPEDYMPSGSVEWCTLSLGKTIVPDYYPDWISEHIHRKVWKSNEWVLGEKYFVKPADKHKRFDGFCTFGTWSKKKKPPYWYSDIVKFQDEWRYYITKGKVLCGHWYWGDEINTPDAPKLDVYIPESFSGTLDFGYLDNGKFALVESHPPFACGWYGDREDDTYLQWLIDGWIYLKSI